jgi:ATP-binding cassette subfamily F protein 3
MKKKKKESIAESFEQSESQIKQLEKDIQHDDKMLASNYNKILKMFFFKAYNKRKQSWISCFDWEKVQDEIEA